MELRDRVFGPIRAGGEHNEARIDFGDLVRKLVIFEDVVLESTMLEEFPPMIQKFGYDGVKALLDSGRVRIHCETLMFGEIGRTTELQSRARKGALPLGSYSFATVRIADRKDYIHKSLQPINEAPGLKGRQAQKLRKLVAERIVAPPEDSGARAQAYLMRDLEDNLPWLKTSVALAAANEFGRPIEPNAFDLRVEKIDDEDFRTETNIGERLGLDAQAVHQLVSRGLLGVGGLNTRIEFMERYHAVTGFMDNELPLFDSKIGFLVRQIDPGAHLERFQHVVKLAGLPDVSSDPAIQDVDLPRLIEILRSDEVREFRRWLRSVDSLDDADVEHEIGKLREHVRHAVHSSLGKGIRFSATAGIGVLMPPAGIALGALDSLVLDRLVREPGPTAFLSRLYPTVFRS